jgi:hypothetical protein
LAEFNSCAALATKTGYAEVEQLYEKLLSEGKDPYQMILDMQNSLQEKLAELYPDRAKKPTQLATCGEVYDWVRDQKTAIDDEFSELVSAIPGVDMPEKARTAIWKKWKANYPDLRAKQITDLTRDEMLELQFEKIDIDHFTANIDLALGIDAKTRFCMYFLKNLENLRRYNSGY